MIDTLFHLDSVTGLLDRSSCLLMAEEMAQQASSNADGHSHRVAAVWIDIDRFRQINESYGHQGGDSVVAALAQRLRERLGGRGELGRMGADEFVCLAPNLTQEQAQHLAEEMAQAIGQPMPCAEIMLRLTASVGLAVREPGESGATLLERADRAMGAAKQMGGNRCMVSGSEPVPGRLGILLLREELAIEQALHEALDLGALELHYQPIMQRSGHIHGVEALMRCSVGPPGMSPARFVPVAEKTGLIVRMGEWSLLQGAVFARRMRQAGRPMTVAINVSRAQMLDAQFSVALSAALLCANADPSTVELELTESLFMDVSVTVQDNLRGARAMGVGLAIDDFGTGYSCLANLKDMPATKLKLDRAFVRELPHDPRSVSVVRAMTQLAQDLGMIVTAEGAETAAQVQCLLDLGVDQIQGYHLARPMDEDSLLNWLATRGQA